MDKELLTRERVEKLAQRANRCCCKYCGGELEVRMIVFASVKDAGVEIFCPHCNRIEYGVEPEIYQNARYFVENLGYNASPEAEDEGSKNLNIAKVCEMLTWNDMQLGFLTDNGFVYEPKEHNKKIEL